MGKFDVRELLRQKLAEEPEAVFQALLGQITDLENQLTWMRSQMEKMKAGFEHHQHAPEGAILLRLGGSWNLNDVQGMGFGPPQNALENFCRRLSQRDLNGVEKSLRPMCLSSPRPGGGRLG